MSIPDDTARLAHGWYAAERTRSIEEAALRIDHSPQQLRAAWKRLGLASKGRHEAKVGKAHKNQANRPPSSGVPGPTARIVRPSEQRRERRWR